MTINKTTQKRQVRDLLKAIETGEGDLPDYATSIGLDKPFRPPEPTEDSEGVDGLLHVLGTEAPRAAAELGRQGVTGRRLVRALLTLRPPAPLPDGVHEMIDRLLANVLADRGVVDAASLERLDELGSDAPFALCAFYKGDITRLRIDAIVNAANSALLGCFIPFHACIDNAIHDRAGPRLRADCQVIMAGQRAAECVGAAKVTRAYNLPSRYVLHTVGPTVQGPLREEHRQQLTASYEACLDLATRVGARSPSAVSRPACLGSPSCRRPGSRWPRWRTFSAVAPALWTSWSSTSSAMTTTRPTRLHSMNGGHHDFSD